MLGKALSRAGALAAAVCAFSLGADDAGATTFCVPSFSAACPNSGGNVAEADLEQAMSLEATDGKADEIRLAAGTFTEAAAPYEPVGGSGETLEPTGSDPLTVVGAGPAASVITSVATSNVFIVNLDFNNTRQITLKDLTVRVPASAADGLGAALQIHGDTLENVDLVSRNDESDGIASAVGSGNVFRDGEIRGEAGGSIGDAVHGGSAVGGSLLVEDAVLSGASWGLVSADAGSTLPARRVSEIGTRVYGAIATRGTLIVENSTMRIDDGIGLYASADANSSLLHADHVTIVNSGGSGPALEAKKFSGTAGSAQIEVSNSVLRGFGFGSGYRLETPIGPGVGQIGVEARYSDLPLTGTNVNGAVDLSTGNADVDPLLNADLSLPAGSPAVDAGDPASGGLDSDFAGAPRPRDGNGDGSAIRDQGAFEYQPPTAVVDPVGSGEPGATRSQNVKPAPQTSIAKGPGRRLAEGVAKFRFRSSEPGSRFACMLDKRKAKPCRSPKSYTGLKPGRHVFKVWATDAGGNKDPTPAKRSFRVPTA